METVNQQGVTLTKAYVKEQFEQDREDYVYLPIGVVYEGQVIRLVQIKESDGYTEELQSSEAYRKHLTTIVTATLADCITNILDYQLPQNQDKALNVKEEIVKLMAEPDRQYLMSRIYKLQHGDSIKATCNCTNCQGQNQPNISLYEDFNINYLDESLFADPNIDRMIIREVELTQPITVGGQTFDKINVRMPNGATALSLEKVGGNMGQVLTKMILQMIACNVDKFIPNENEIKRWSSKVRRGLVEAVGTRRVGFINSFKFTCEHCNTESEAPVTVTSFLEN